MANDRMAVPYLRMRLFLAPRFTLGKLSFQPAIIAIQLRRCLLLSIIYYYYYYYYYFQMCSE